MKYVVRVWSAVHGDTVPLIYVAIAMARHAAMGYGTLPLHGPTLKNLLPERTALLREAANKGLLPLCDGQGHEIGRNELIQAAKLSNDLNTSDLLATLHVTKHHLTEWGKARGDDFVFVETPGEVVNQNNEDRGAVGGGESEWFVEPEGNPGFESMATASALTRVAVPRAVPRLRAQEGRILEILSELGLVSKSLPARVAGRKGIKAEIKLLALCEPSLFTKSSFDKAWQRLRDDDRLGGD